MFSIPFDTTFALFLTHRRGAAVLVSKPDGSLSIDERIETLRAAITNAVEKDLSRPDNAEQISLHFQNFSIAIHYHGTAEYLTALYAECLAKQGITDRDVNHIVVGTGPNGSFTGLRLGCAFANGLSCANKRTLWSIHCFSVQEAAQQASNHSPIHGQAFYPVIPLPQHEFSYPLGLPDLLMAIKALELPDCRPAEFLLPEYSSEPGPVIKLRQGLLKTQGELHE